MEVLILGLIAIAVMLTILYRLIKYAVKNGTVEAAQKLEAHMLIELKKAIRDGISAAAVSGNMPRAELPEHIQNIIEEVKTAQQGRNEGEI